MQSIPPTENTASKATYEAIKKELSREIELGLGERCKKSFEATLAIFTNANLSRLDHQNWRDTDLSISALALHTKRYKLLNPESEIKDQWESALAANDTETLLILGEEIDDKGHTQYEYIVKWEPRYPAHSRKDLDVWAAEEYVRSKERQIKPRNQEPEEACPKEVRSKSNKNPHITYEKLVMELVAEPGITREAVRQRSYDCINKNKGKEYPWRMGGCANKYQIINAPINDGRDKPTPGSCFYQKIDQETA